MNEDETARGIKTLFAQKLKRAMYNHGLTQAELARRAERHLPEGMVFHKTSISRYCNAEQVPDPIRLRAVADDVGALEIKDIGGGRCQLRINQEVSFATAAKIFALLGHETTE